MELVFKHGHVKVIHYFVMKQFTHMAHPLSQCSLLLWSENQVTKNNR